MAQPFESVLSTIDFAPLLTHHSGNSCCRAFDFAGAPSLRCLKGWEVLIFFLDHRASLTSIRKINLDQGIGLPLVGSITTPAPVFRMRHQTAFDGIRVHVVELLDFLLPTPHVEIVETALPEAAETYVRWFVPETQLRRGRPFAGPLAEFS